MWTHSFPRFFEITLSLRGLNGERRCKSVNANFTLSGSDMVNVSVANKSNVFEEYVAINTLSLSTMHAWKRVVSGLAWIDMDT